MLNQLLNKSSEVYCCVLMYLFSSPGNRHEYKSDKNCKRLRKGTAIENEGLRFWLCIFEGDFYSEGERSGRVIG